MEISKKEKEINANDEIDQDELDQDDEEELITNENQQQQNRSSDGKQEVTTTTTTTTSNKTKNHDSTGEPPAKKQKIRKRGTPIFSPLTNHPSDHKLDGSHWVVCIDTASNIFGRLDEYTQLKYGQSFRFGIIIYFLFYFGSCLFYFSHSFMFLFFLFVFSFFFTIHYRAVRVVLGRQGHNQPQLILRSVEPLPTKEFESFITKIYNDPHVFTYVNRFYPVSHKVPLPSHDPFDLSFLINGLPKQIDGKTPIFRVQGHPRKVQDILVTTGKDKFEMHPKKFTHVLTCLKLEDDFYYWGIGARETYYYDKDDNAVIANREGSRAASKFEEVNDRLNFGIKPDWHCLDVGAAPGGISLKLSKLCPKGIVVAVDPGELTIGTHPNLIHCKGLFENCQEEVKKNGPYDFVV